MAKKKIPKDAKHEAQYVKNILKYGNPYGPMPKAVDIRVEPVRKFIVPGSGVGGNVLADTYSAGAQDPYQPTNIASGGAGNAYGGVSSINQLAQPINQNITAGPGQVDLGNPSMASNAPGWGASNQAPSLSSVLTSVPSIQKAVNYTPFLNPLTKMMINFPLKMSYNEAASKVDNFGQTAQMSPTGEIVGNRGMGFDQFGNPVGQDLSTLTNDDFGMFSELDTVAMGIGQGNVGVGDLDGTPDAIGAED